MIQSYQCGYYGDLKRECRCSPNQIAKYRQKISGPLLDRIDIHIDVPIIEYKEFTSDKPGEASEPIRQRVETARAIQTERFRSSKNVNSNSAMPPKLMKVHCNIDDASKALMEQAMNDLNFSARAHDRILKVSRTLADLAGSESITTAHLLEAIQYRSLDRSLWE